LLVQDESDPRLGASARLLPTVGPHLMLDLFGSLCDGAVPCGPWTWEASRFCPNPDIKERGARLDLLWQIICGIMETAMLFGMERITFVANRALLPLALECGWDAVRLGDTRPDGNDEMTAVSVSVTQNGLRRVRATFDIPCPIVRFYPPKVRAAA
jgi:N-acyl-L-homoserine lactone synthetase